MRLKTSLILALAIVTVGVSACATTASPSAQTPQTVDHVRLDDYLGTWYEIGRLPMSFQNKCTHNVTANYTLKDNGKIKVLNTCQTKDGQMSADGEAYPIDDTNAKLKVSFLPSFLKKLPIAQADYWVLATTEDAQNYTSALVGTPDRKYLWVLSRTPSLDERIYQNYLDIARQNGYDLSAFSKTPQK
ncbi:lipocalin family protein [Moraxella canis]|uniref:lipocalin family protein n=1 Tax=Moraxella canis TaxID=90239 RepID=UPI00069DC817|nr:lipocalin family protein [Moraxella canis]